MSEARITYVVTAGEYSDYRILGVFTTKALAEEFVREWPNEDYNQIEEHETDPNFPRIPHDHDVYFVRMFADGSVKEARKERKTLFNASAYAFEPDSVGSFMASCVARDREHAIKIANERRVQYLARVRADLNPHSRGEPKAP